MTVAVETLEVVMALEDTGTAVGAETVRSLAGEVATVAIPAQVVGEGSVGRAVWAVRAAQVGPTAARAVLVVVWAAASALAGRTGSSYHLPVAPPSRASSAQRRRRTWCEALHTWSLLAAPSLHQRTGWPSSLARWRGCGAGGWHCLFRLPSHSHPR